MAPTTCLGLLIEAKALEFHLTKYIKLILHLVFIIFMPYHMAKMLKNDS